MFAARRMRWLLAAVAGTSLLLGGLAAVRIVRPDVVPVSLLSAGPFTLMDQAGRTVTERDLQGRPSLMYFGYTHCPDICPTTLFELSAVMAALGPDAERFDVLFVTVDPRRDTPAVMRAYVQAFDPRIRALTGSPEAVAAMMAAYGARATMVGGENNYAVDHSTAVLVLDRMARPEGTLSLGQPPADVADGLRRRWLAAGS